MSTLQEVLAVLLGAESEAKRIVGDSKNEAESMLQTAQEKFASERTSRMAAARGQAKDLMEAALNSAKTESEQIVNLGKEELLARGVNQSSTHVDFMIGTDDLNVFGISADGTETPVFVNGQWAWE